MTSCELYRAEGLPVLQNKMFLSEEDAKCSRIGNVVLIQNPKTGIVENVAFDPSLIQYDQSYQNEQSVSGYFKEHLEQVKHIVIQKMGTGPLIEVGCGKGYFLNMLQDAGVSVKGIDPAYEGNDPDIIQDMFRPGIGIQGNGIVLRHVLEHIQNPIDFLNLIADANNKGLIYIEVPCFDWITQNNAWFDVFYEHVNYFRMEDFYRIFSSVKDTGHLFGGQYLYVVADLASLASRSQSFEFSCVRFPTSFGARLENLIQHLKTKEGKVVVWGGASKGVMFTLYGIRSGLHFDYLVDINPAKQGKYTPVTGLYVSSPQEVISDPDVQYIIIMNSNYLNEIKDFIGNRYNYLTVDKSEF